MAVGKYLRGAIIQFTETFPLPVPNVIVFQFNPETMTHTWTPTRVAQESPTNGPEDPSAVTGSPQESFSFTLAMDASDMITDGGPIEAGLASATGLYTRLAALEMLLFPTAKPGAGLIGSIAASVSIGGSGASFGGSGGASTPTQSVPDSRLPTAIFVWGPGRIVPVRVSSLTITEKLYDGTLLNPTRAEAQVSLQVLRQEDLRYVTGPIGDLARAALSYSQGLRQALAIANLGNAVSDIIGMLPI
jgi:hypothetical protein